MVVPVRDDARATALPARGVVRRRTYVVGSVVEVLLLSGVPLGGPEGVRIVETFLALPFGGVHLRHQK